MAKKCFAFLLTILAGSLFAATLNVDFDVRTSEDKHAAAASKRKEVVVFVLDQSYSMKNTAGEVERPDHTRDAVLREMLELRLKTMSEKQPDAQVYVITFAGDMRGPYGPFNPKDDKKIFSKLECKRGGTLLYDTLAYAVEFGEGLLANDPSVRIRMFVYSDGENQLFKGKWDRECEKTSFGITYTSTESVDVRYRGGDAAESFKKDYLKRIQDNAKSGRMSLETGCWLGAGAPPAFIENKRKDDYKLDFTSDGKELKNPATNPEQTMNASLVLPIPKQYEKELASVKATVEMDVQGKKVRGRVSLKPGKNTVKLELPAGLPEKAFTGKMRIVDIPDVWDRISLSSPGTVDLSFAAPGALSFASVEPSGDVYVKVGDSVNFAAKASDGAAVAWKLDDEKVDKAEFSRKFDAPGTHDHDVSVEAVKKGFKPAVSRFKVHVVDTAVSVSASASGPKVGDKVGFTAKTNAKAVGYAWWVDGQQVAERSNVLKDRVFDSAEKHVVKVQAAFGNGLSGGSECTVDVAVKPYISVKAPAADQLFDFGAEIKAFAVVEGKYEDVVWQLTGPDAKSETVKVDQKEHISKPISFKPAKGGAYVLKATAKGADAELSDEVKFSVKREDVMVRIDKPVDGASVEVGKPFEVSASVKGSTIKNVKWTILKGTEAIKSISVPVAGGVSSKAFELPKGAVAAGTALFVKAEAEDDPEASSMVEVEAMIFSRLKIVSAKVGGREVNGAEIKFNDQIAMEAMCAGAVDSEKIEWWSEINGNRKKLTVSGLTVNTPKVNPDANPSGPVIAYYWAQSKLPDDSIKESRKIMVEYACDDIAMTVELPTGADGLPQKSFKPGDDIHLNLKVEGGTLDGIVWESGKERKNGANVVFKFTDEERHAITVSGKCPKCGRVYKQSFWVSTACPDLEFAPIVPKNDAGTAKSEFGLSERVNVEVKVVAGDASEVSCDFGHGTPVKSNVASHTYGKYGPFSIVAKAKCRRCGKTFTSEPANIEVKVLPPVAKFDIMEKGSYYTVGSKLHLVSLCEGDVSNLVWKVDGVELAEFTGKREAVVHVSKKPCEMVIELQAFGPAASEPSIATREIRVRFGWIGIVVLVLLALLLIGILAYILSCNGPAAWVAHVWCHEALDLTDDEGLRKERRKFASSMRVDVRRYWSLLDKKASIPLAKLGALDSKIAKFAAKCNAKAKVVVSLDEGSGKPSINRSDLANNDVGRKDLDGHPYRQFRARKEWEEGKEPLFLRIVLDDEATSHRYQVYFVILTLCVIAATFWAALTYAI